MISAKLISEVTGSEFEKCYISKNGKEVNCYYPKGSEYNHAVFNIYELAHKCKEWAVKKGFDIDIKNTKFDNYIDIYHPDKRRLFTNAKSEPEAIFKACQWILEQQK